MAGNPVLSIYQTDIIVYGDDLRAYLLNEFSSIMGMSKAQFVITEDEERIAAQAPSGDRLLASERDELGNRHKPTVALSTDPLLAKQSKYVEEKTLIWNRRRPQEWAS